MLQLSTVPVDVVAKTVLWHNQADLKESTARASDCTKVGFWVDLCEIVEGHVMFSVELFHEHRLNVFN
jgi:hypothetical protein